MAGTSPGTRSSTGDAAGDRRSQPGAGAHPCHPSARSDDGEGEGEDEYDDDDDEADDDDNGMDMDDGSPSDALRKLPAPPPPTTTYFGTPSSSSGGSPSRSDKGNIRLAPPPPAGPSVVDVVHPGEYMLPPSLHYGTMTPPLSTEGWGSDTIETTSPFDGFFPFHEAASGPVVDVDGGLFGSMCEAPSLTTTTTTTGATATATSNNSLGFSPYHAFDFSTGSSAAAAVATAHMDILTPQPDGTGETLGLDFSGSATTTTGYAPLGHGLHTPALHHLDDMASSHAASPASVPGGESVGTVGSSTGITTPGGLTGTGPGPGPGSGSEPCYQVTLSMVCRGAQMEAVLGCLAEMGSEVTMKIQPVAGGGGLVGVDGDGSP